MYPASQFLSLRFMYINSHEMRQDKRTMRPCITGVLVQQEIVKKTIVFSSGSNILHLNRLLGTAKLQKNILAVFFFLLKTGLYPAILRKGPSQNWEKILT